MKAIGSPPWVHMIFSASLLAASLVFTSCGPPRPPAPVVRISRIPPAEPGGPQKLDYVEGSVTGSQPGQQIILYAHSGVWWVQPFADQSQTKILPGGTWRNSTHLGTDYAALLVDPGFRPPSRLSALPPVGAGVIAVAVAAGKPIAPLVQKTLHFSGYDWAVRTAGSDRGGEPNNYDPANAWVDDKGFLHLRMADVNGTWSCAEVNLNRSLGYGTYRLVVQDTAHLGPSAVVGLFTWDDLRSEDFRNELDIELSRWGDAKAKNAQYVLQPFYVPANNSRFMAPPGVVTHSFHWEPGKVTFRSVRGSTLDAAPVAQHVFSSGVPTPASETVHMDIYEFHHARNPSHPPAEVVIEKFEFLP